MAVSEQTTALIAVFKDRAKAEEYLAALRRAGFPEEELGILSPDAAEEVQEQALAGETTAGAIAGGSIGAFAGVLATGLTPGIGPLLAGGLLTGMLGGAAVGATAGGVLGILSGLGLEEEDLRRYEQEYHAGRTLVAVQSICRNAEAMGILRKCEENCP